MEIERRVRRGGCWSYTGILSLVDDRYGYDPRVHSNLIGFRLARQVNVLEQLSAAIKPD